MSASQIQVPPGLDLDESRQNAAIAAVIAFRTLAVIAVALRFYARRVGGSKYWWDDWFILWSGITLVPYLVIELYEVKLGSGRHFLWVQEAQPQNIPTYLKVVYADELSYPEVIGPTKISILLLYIRIFGINRSFRYICYAQIAVTAAWSIATFCVFAFQCSPIYLVWSVDKSSGWCMSFAPLFITPNALNTVTDFIMLITPIYPLYQLRLPWKRKLLVAIVMLVGASEIIVSILRLSKIAPLTFEDPTWDGAITLIYSVCEACIAIICACIPVMGPLFPKRWISKFSGTSTPQYFANKKQPNLSSQSGRVRWGTRNKDGMESLANDEHELVNPKSGIMRTDVIDISTTTSSIEGRQEHIRV